MTTLLFARHGQASFGHQEYDKLSPLGEEQAYLLGEYYAQVQRPIQAVVNGTLSRQQASAQHFLAGYGKADLAVKVETTPRKTIADLNEYDHKDIFMKSDPAFHSEIGILTAIAQAPVPKIRLAELFGVAMQRWHSGNYDADYIESWRQFNARVQQALQEVADYAKQLKREVATNKTAQNLEPAVLIFTSGGVIAAIVANLLISQNEFSANKLTETQLLNQQSQLAYQINRSLVNTGVTSLTLADDLPKLLTLNEHGHLLHKDSRYVTWY